MIEAAGGKRPTSCGYSISKVNAQAEEPVKG